MEGQGSSRAGGKAVKQRFDREFKISAVKMVTQEGLIHHSDRGSQYAGGEYQDLLKRYKITPSMSRKGDCWNNAVGESFAHTLKAEKVNQCRFMTKEEAKREIFEYIEVYYNRKRMHSSLGYTSPFEFEQRFFLTK